MSDRTDAEPRVSLNDLLAAERTYLAWLRTGLASMGFGFVVSYNSSEYLGARHGLPDALLRNVAVVETLAVKAAE